ncbi:MAG TPA: sulfotransferase, partial [Rhizomicrobium sp.]
LVQEVIDAVRAGQNDRARELAIAALDDGLRHPVLFNIRAAWHGRRERYEEALADFEAARIWLPRDPMLLDGIGHCLIMLARPREAVAALDIAIGIAPELAALHYRKGVALWQLNEMQEMRLEFERVVALQPDHADALASLAFIAARSGNVADARAFAAQAMSCAPRHNIARIALAIADMEDGDFLAAGEKLDAVLADCPATDDGRLNNALGFAADALDRNNRVSGAFRLHGVVNDRRRGFHAKRYADCRAIDDVARLTEYFRKSGSWNASEPAAADGGAAGHVFLLGFVRSGTTLLEAVLASNPLVVASDEHDHLANAAHEYLDRDEDVDTLRKSEADRLASWREAYWNSVRGTGMAIDGKIFVDKVPFNSLRLPLILRLFPDARILLALRDPRDVVLSAYRRRFNMYPSSFEFLRLDDCARYYAAIMLFVETCRDRLPLAVHEHRYEDMIVDFGASVRAICGFIGIEWDEAMRDFGAAASALDKRNQSASQVRRGLYSGGIGQWRRYREHLSAVLPILQPWVERFGYDPD